MELEQACSQIHSHDLLHVQDEFEQVSVRGSPRDKHIVLDHATQCDLGPLHHHFDSFLYWLWCGKNYNWLGRIHLSVWVKRLAGAAWAVAWVFAWGSDVSPLIGRRTIRDWRRCCGYRGGSAITDRRAGGGGAVCVGAWMMMVGRIGGWGMMIGWGGGVHEWRCSVGQLEDVR